MSRPEFPAVVSWGNFINGEHHSPRGKRDYVKGNYLLPTTFAGVNSDMRIWKEEIFGPVLHDRR